MALSEQQILDLEKKGLDLNLVNKYERSIFLLQNLSNTLVQDYDEYMKSFGIKGKCSEYSSKIKKLMEEYFQSVRKAIPEDQSTLFLINYEDFEKDFREKVDLPELKPLKRRK